MGSFSLKEIFFWWGLRPRPTGPKSMISYSLVNLDLIVRVFGNEYLYLGTYSEFRLLILSFPSLLLIELCCPNIRENGEITINFATKMMSCELQESKYMLLAEWKGTKHVSLSMKTLSLRGVPRIQKVVRFWNPRNIRKKYEYLLIRKLNCLRGYNVFK